jgi:hypothetical protein
LQRYPYHLNARSEIICENSEHLLNGVTMLTICLSDSFVRSTQSAARLFDGYDFEIHFI